MCTVYIILNNPLIRWFKPLFISSALFLLKGWREGEDIVLLPTMQFLIVRNERARQRVWIKRDRKYVDKFKLRERDKSVEKERE